MGYNTPKFSKQIGHFQFYDENEAKFLAKYCQKLSNYVELSVS